MGKHNWYDCTWEIVCKRNGETIWSESGKNSLLDEGERAMLTTYFRGADQPTQFYVRLCNDVLLETDSLVDVKNEPSGNGYEPQLIERSEIGWPVIELNDGDWRLTSKLITFAAVGGDIGPFNTAFLATTSDNTGKIVCAKAFSTSRTISVGDLFEFQIKPKLK